jgi:hypothetical protein
MGNEQSSGITWNHQYTGNSPNDSYLIDKHKVGTFNYVNPYDDPYDDENSK